MNRAILIDRDGVINKLPPKYPNDGVGDIRNYITKWEDFEFLPGVMEAFGMIEELNYLPVVVSNQGGAIGRGLIDYQTIMNLFSVMKFTIMEETEGSDVPATYFCPHAHVDRCCCCKPKPGMLYQAAIEHDICLEDSWMIGDSDSDMVAGYNAGVGGKIYINSKMDKNALIIDMWRQNNGDVVKALTKPSLLEAVKYIMETDNGNKS